MGSCGCEHCQQVHASAVCGLESYTMLYHRQPLGFKVEQSVLKLQLSSVQQMYDIGVVLKHCLHLALDFYKSLECRVWQDSKKRSIALLFFHAHLELTCEVETWQIRKMRHSAWCLLQRPETRKRFRMLFPVPQ